MKKRYDYILSGYVGSNQIIRVNRLPQVGVTEIVRNHDNSTLYPGGNAYNVSAALAALGLAALPIMRGGYDVEKAGFWQALQEKKVSLEAFTKVEKAPTGLCYLVQDEEKEHLTLFYPGAMGGEFAPECLPDEWFQNSGAAVLLVGSRRDNRLFLDRVRANGLPLVFGMRADFDAFPKDLLWEILTQAELIFANEVESRLICEMYGLLSLAALFERGRAKIIVSTLGKKGSEVYEKAGGKRTFVPVTPSGRPVDATGVGDSYIAGYLYGLCNGKDAVQCAEYGSTVASFVVEQIGCTTCLPTVEEMLARNKTRETKE